MLIPDALSTTMADLQEFIWEVAANLISAPCSYPRLQLPSENKGFSSFALQISSESLSLSDLNLGPLERDSPMMI